MPVTQVKSKQQFLVTDNVSFQDLYRLTNLVNPVNAQDAATKSYVDALKQSLDRYREFVQGKHLFQHNKQQIVFYLIRSADT